MLRMTKMRTTTMLLMNFEFYHFDENQLFLCGSLSGGIRFQTLLQGIGRIICSFVDTKDNYNENLCCTNTVVFYLLPNSPTCSEFFDLKYLKSTKTNTIIKCDCNRINTQILYELVCTRKMVWGGKTSKTQKIYEIFSFSIVFLSASLCC